jgi:hypothetical protein
MKMKFTSILRKVILEQSKYEILRAVTQPSTNKEGKKVKPKMTVDEYNALVAADPMSRLNNIDLASAEQKDFDKIKAGKYVQWLIKSFLNVVPDDYEVGQPGYDKALKMAKDRFMEDLYKVTNSLAKYEKFKQKLPQESREINKLNPDQLYDLVKDFSLEKTKASAEEKKEATQTYAHPGGKVVFPYRTNFAYVDIKTLQDAKDYVEKHYPKSERWQIQLLAYESLVMMDIVFLIHLLCVEHLNTSRSSMVLWPNMHKILE